MTSGRPGLNIYERRRRARTGDESLEAVAHRLRAARLAFGHSIEDLTGSRGWYDPASVRDAEAGKRWPEDFHTWFFRLKYEIPVEFFLEGEISLLPAPVEPRLFAQLI